MVLFRYFLLGIWLSGWLGGQGPFRIIYLKRLLFLRGNGWFLAMAYEQVPGLGIELIMGKGGVQTLPQRNRLGMVLH